MNRFGAAVRLVVIFVLLGAVGAGVAAPPETRGLAQVVAPAIQDSLERLSTHIVSGEVKEVSSYAGERGVIHTRAVIAVTSVAKGSLSAPEIVLEFEGGEMDGGGMDVFTLWAFGDGALSSKNPEFYVGEAVTLYLQKDGPAFQLTLGGLGKTSPGLDLMSPPGGYGYSRLAHTWNPNNLPFGYYLNQYGTPDIPGTQEFTAVRAAFDTWENDVGSFMNFTDLGVTAWTGDMQDGHNVVDWVNQGDNGKLAITHLWWPDGVWISEADTVFNDYYQWSTNALQNVGTHEVGHTFGLNDLGNWFDNEDQWETMFYRSTLQETYKKTLYWGDIAGIRNIFPHTHLAGGGLGWESQGADVAAGYINENGQPDMVLARVNNGDPNYIFYWIGYDMSSFNGQVTPPWSDLRWYPYSVGWDTAGLGAALTNIDANPRPDLLLVWVNRVFNGVDGFYYSVGMNLGTDGWPVNWTPAVYVPVNALETQAAGVAVANLDSDPRPDMVINWTDAYELENRMFYKVFWNLDEGGHYSGESYVGMMPSVLAGEVQGAGVTILNLDSEQPGGMDYVMFWLNSEAGPNTQRYRIGWNVSPTTGLPSRWSREFDVQGAPPEAEHTAGAGIANANLDADGRPDLIAMWVDNPPGEDYMYYRMV